MKSLIQPVSAMLFPAFKPAHIYMLPFELSETLNLLGEFAFLNEIVNKIRLLSPIKNGIAHLTVDFKTVEAGRSHRRGGAHTDGNYLFGWDDGAGGGWLTGTAGRLLTPDKHKAQYCSDLGGTLIISDFSACQAWVGVYNEEPRQGGDCSHVELGALKNIMLEHNVVYLMNSTCIHESMPLPKSVNRKLILVTLPATEEVL